MWSSPGGSVQPRPESAEEGAPRIPEGYSLGKMQSKRRPKRRNQPERQGGRTKNHDVGAVHPRPSKKVGMGSNVEKEKNEPNAAAPNNRREKGTGDGLKGDPSAKGGELNRDPWCVCPTRIQRANRGGLYRGVVEKTCAKGERGACRLVRGLHMKGW